MWKPIYPVWWNIYHDRSAPIRQTSEKLFERALCERHVLESLTAGTLDIRAEICDFGNCQAMIYQVVADPPRSQGSMRKSA